MPMGDPAPHKTRISIVIERCVVARLKEEGRRSGVTFSEIIRRAVNAYFHLPLPMRDAAASLPTAGGTEAGPDPPPDR